MLAILGPSGAGKTTLLSLLTLRAPAGEARGGCTLGGRPLTHSVFRRRCFYVPQNSDGAAWPTLTPREQLLFAAALFRAGGAERVEEVLKQLGLESCADTLVGHDLVPGGLSGGQKKRLAVAVALVKRAAWFRVRGRLPSYEGCLDARRGVHRRLEKCCLNARRGAHRCLDARRGSRRCACFSTSPPPG